MTVTRLTIRALLFRRRSLALLFPVAAVVFFVALAIIRGDVIPDTQAIIVGRLLVTTVAPLVALVLAVTAIGDERESGTIVYLATARISRLQIAAEKTLAAAICAAILLSPAFVAIAILGSHLGVGTDNILRGIAGTLLVATVYSAVFVMVGLLLRRALVVGILYILVWEGAIATIAPSAERFSMTAWGRGITDGGIYGLTPDLVPTLGASTGVIALVVVTLLAVVLAGWRLGRMDLP
ncbi:MAG: ABC transporter permease subunit [Thermoleophilia bacterium]